jgi:hypothetical protein
VHMLNRKGYSRLEGPAVETVGARTDYISEGIRFTMPSMTVILSIERTRTYNSIPLRKKNTYKNNYYSRVFSVDFLVYSDLLLSFLDYATVVGLENAGRDRCM